MSNWPSYGHGPGADALFTLSSTTRGVALTTGVADTKGAWVELVGLTIQDYEGVVVLPQLSASGRTILVDIGVGAAGSEKAKIPNFKYDTISNAQGSGIAPTFPLAVAEGLRVAMRGQASSASLVVTLGAQGLPQTFLGMKGSAEILDIGVDTANSKGTVIDAGGSANTKGAWTELVESLSQDIFGFVVSWGHNEDVGFANEEFAFDIGVGVAGSEKIIVPDGLMGTSSADDRLGPIGFMYPISIAAGSRISARLEADGTASVILDLNLHGFVA